MPLPKLSLFITHSTFTSRWSSCSCWISACMLRAGAVLKVWKLSIQRLAWSSWSARGLYITDQWIFHETYLYALQHRGSDFLDAGGFSRLGLNTVSSQDRVMAPSERHPEASQCFHTCVLAMSVTETGLKCQSEAVHLTEDDPHKKTISFLPKGKRCII